MMKYLFLLVFVFSGYYSISQHYLYFEIPECNVTNIDDKSSNGPKLVVFPNPVQQSLHVDFYNFVENQKISCEIYDILGSKVFTKEYYPNQAKCRLSIDVSSFYRGNYVMKITSEQEIIHKKIVVN